MNNNNNGFFINYRKNNYKKNNVEIFLANSANSWQI
jgi:hypothetical protein